MAEPSSARPRARDEADAGAHESTRILAALARGVEPELIDARGVAATLGCSVRHVRGLHARGALPAPVRLGGCVRWRRREIEAWTDAGCPTREAWERLRAARGGRS